MKKKSKDDKSKIAEYMYIRLQEVLEWYVDCIWCGETKESIEADVASVFRETEKKFKLKPIVPNPIVRMSNDGYVEVVWNNTLLN